MHLFLGVPVTGSYVTARNKLYQNIKESNSYVKSSYYLTGAIDFFCSGFVVCPFVRLFVCSKHTFNVSMTDGLKLCLESSCLLNLCLLNLSDAFRLKLGPCTTGQQRNIFIAFLMDIIILYTKIRAQLYSLYK